MCKYRAMHDMVVSRGQDDMVTKYNDKKGLDVRQSATYRSNQVNNQLARYNRMSIKSTHLVMF